jgi:hypothetical protein
MADCMIRPTRVSPAECALFKQFRLETSKEARPLDFTLDRILPVVTPAYVGVSQARYRPFVPGGLCGFGEENCWGGCKSRLAIQPK